MFFNRNTIDNNFKPDIKTEHLFDPKSKDKIKIVIEVANDSIFSIFIKNNQDIIVKLVPQDNSLYLIQEALDKKNQWKPVEFWSYSTCGNSYDNKINFEPNAILHLTTEKYSGNFKTKIRFRLLIDNQIYFSNELPSSLNITKFEKSKQFFQLSKMYKILTELNVEDLMFLRRGF